MTRAMKSRNLCQYTSMSLSVSAYFLMLFFVEIDQTLGRGEIWHLTHPDPATIRSPGMARLGRHGSMAPWVQGQGPVIRGSCQSTLCRFGTGRVSGETVGNQRKVMTFELGIEEWYRNDQSSFIANAEAAGVAKSCKICLEDAGIVRICRPLRVCLNNF